MSERRLTSVILAAGEGTRMRSSLAKVLHPVAGRPMVGHAVASAVAAGSDAVALVVGPGRDDVARAGAAAAGEAAVSIFVQGERRGTAHAALHARAAIAAASDDVVVAFGDTPLVRPETFAALRAPLAGGAAVVVGAFRAADPTGYGRVLTREGAPVAIREEKEASAAERAIDLVNGGLMAFSAATMLDLLDAIGDDNAKREFYITDAITLACARGLATALVEISAEDVSGVNDRAQLAGVEAIMQARLRRAALTAGVGMIAPETVFLAYDTVFAEDVLLHPHVVIRPGVTLERGVEILSFSHLEGARVRAGARIGPFARLRPKTEIGEGAHVGNFVEINRSTLGPQVEANHLAYIGDARVGQGSNIGAGTITCNFDGADKHPTVIGRDVFVGSNATLVAPLTIGDEVLVAAGSTLTRDVEEGALVFGRAKQEALPERGRRHIRANKVRRAERKARGG